MLRIFILGFLLLFVAGITTASEKLNYQLNAVEIAKNTYLFEGKTEDFSRKNGGNILNTGFIVTGEGVVVIDSGPSRRWPSQRSPIARSHRSTLASCTRTISSVTRHSKTRPSPRCRQRSAAFKPRAKCSPTICTAWWETGCSGQR